MRPQSRTAPAAKPRESLADKFERILLARIIEGRLVIPLLPDVALACLTLLKQPDFAQRQMVAKLERDPLLVVQVMRAANVAAYGESVHSIDQAVSRLGAVKLKSVIVEASARPLFESRDLRISAATKGLWQHSIAVALLARDLAALAGDPNSENVYLAGLLHDVGKAVTAGMLLEAERSLGESGTPFITSDDFVTVIGRVHRKVGVAMVEKWGLPKSVCDSVREASEYNSGDRHCASNFVCFANAVAKLEGCSVGPFDKDDTEAIVMIGRSLIGADDQSTKRLAADLAERARQHV